MRIWWTPEVSDHWVLEDEDGLWAMPAGGDGSGTKVPFTGDRAMLEPLDGQSVPPWLLRVELVGVPDIADRAGVQPDTVRKWRQRHGDFPAPLATLASGPVWSWATVERWLGSHAAIRQGEPTGWELPIDPYRRDSQTSAPRWQPTARSLFDNDTRDGREYAFLESGHSGWPVYGQGYRRAGQVLVGLVMDTGHDQDLLVYPLVFVYRQYLELQLKHVISLGRRLHGGGRGRPVETHSLSALWEMAHRHIVREWPRDDVDTDAIRADLEELDAVDHGSYAFRYPIGRGQEPSLPEHLRRFNVKSFAERAEAIGAYLDGASEGLWQHLEAEREMAMEYAP